jgi:hypothetical protein
MSQDVILGILTNSTRFSNPAQIMQTNSLLPASARSRCSPILAHRPIHDYIQ